MHDGARAQECDGLDAVLELPNVAVPRVPLERGVGLAVESEGHPIVPSCRETLEERFREHADVAAFAVAERRDLDLDAAQAVVEVLAKETLVDPFLGGPNGSQTRCER